MCGISGISGIEDSELAGTLVSDMNNAMKHRGPDDDGVCTIGDVALGHRRLSIIDLSSAGHQPMYSNDNSCVIVFNGEIYNYQTIKSGIPDYAFKTKTDTEVILAAYEKWGLECVEKLDGMFAFALYDNRLKRLILVRDRLGVKPLYYSRTADGVFIFASEIRSLLASGRVKRKLNESQLGNYLTFQTTIGDETLIDGIYLLSPGSYAIVENKNFSIHKYWTISSEETCIDTFETAKETTRDLFFKAVEKRMISDVPLGVFLSGGVDSSAVVAAMTATGAVVNSFNINFSDKRYSEAVYAEMVAKRYKTNHVQIDLQAGDFLKLLPTALASLDYPSWDGINTFVVSKAVKEAGISVALSGIGGDEWFGGYPVFDLLNNRSLASVKLVPAAIRKMVFNGISALMNDYSKEKKFELLSGPINIENSYYAIRKLFTASQISSILTRPSDFNHAYHPSSSKYSEISIAEWQNYLMPVLLRDTDQMSMAHSLEIREPLLDYRLVEYVMSVPDAFKKGKLKKSLFIDSLAEWLPSDIVNRPKMGFVLPWQQWLKEDLKDIVNEGLDQLCRNSAFNAVEIDLLRKNYFNNHGNVRWTMILNLTVLGFWLKRNEIE